MARDYEREFADALALLGYRVITNAQWKKDKAFHTDPCLVVSQYMPRPPSLISGTTRNWQCDFAFPPFKVSCEIDGFFGEHSVGAHRTFAGFHRDREKSRDLAFQGWRTLSYGPGDLREWVDVMRCADEFVRFYQKVKTWKQG